MDARMRTRTLLSAITLLVAILAGWSQSLTWLGTVADDWNGVRSAAYGVTDEGIVVGEVSDIFWSRAFRWQNGVMQNLGTMGGVASLAYGVSADGTVVVGYWRDASMQVRAFRWTQTEGMRDLRPPNTFWSEARGVSADGSVVVGWAENSSGLWRALRWTPAGGVQDIGTLGGREAWAIGVSADGQVIVGTAQDTAGRYRAFRWTPTRGMQNLGILPGYERSFASAVSANGSVVVGSLERADDRYGRQSHAFRWTPTEGMQNLGTLGGVNSYATSASGEGAIVVGYAEDASRHYCAFRWTQASGMEDLNRTYAYLLSAGSRLTAARAISPNGRYIVGSGFNASTQRWEAFLLDTAPSCTAHNGDVDNNRCIDDADLLAVLFAFGNTDSASSRADVNCDGIVDDSDLLTVLFNFGSGC